MKPETPTGADLVRAAVYDSDAAKQRVVEAEAVVAKAEGALATAKASLAKAKAEHKAAEDRFVSLLAVGACTAENGCGHNHGDAASPATVQETTEPQVQDEPEPQIQEEPEPVKPKPLYSLEDKIPIVWRIAFQLLADPVMDYQRTAERLWGLNLNKGVAKNRVNAHITQLRKMGVVTSLGNNRFAVNKELLAKHSKLPMTTEAAP